MLLWAGPPLLAACPVNIVMTNLFAAPVTSKIFITAAYKYVALAVMLTNCNLFVQETHLPLDHPMAQTNIILSRCSVNPPRLMGFGGSVVTEKYFFGFGHDHLANFWQWKFHAESSPNIRAQEEKWAKMFSQIGTNDVHQLALNWLADLGVDTAMLEKKYPCEIKQEFFTSIPLAVWCLWIKAKCRCQSLSSHGAQFRSAAILNTASRRSP